MLLSPMNLGKRVDQKSQGLPALPVVKESHSNPCVCNLAQSSRFADERS